MPTYTGLSGKLYTLESDRFQSGGEASLFHIQNHPNLAAKLYNSDILNDPTKRSEKERKLKAMAQMNISPYLDGQLRLAWPMDLLYEQGRMVGFIMPKVQDPINFFDVQRFNREAPASLATQNVLAAYPNFNWKYSAQIAYHLAALVAFLHAKGIVIGDLNQKNILLDSKTSQVILVDCDSFQFTDPKTHETFYCEVGMPEILPPELQQQGRFKGKFSKHTDNFSLAVHIFRLLLQNADPFGGIGSQGPSRSAVDVGNRDILEGNCPYVRSCGLKIPAFVPDYTLLPQSVRILFDRTFNYTSGTAKARAANRATGLEWVKALKPYCLPRSKAITSCSKNPKHHVYPAHNTYCPWCALNQRRNQKPGAKPKQNSAAFEEPKKQTTPPNYSSSQKKAQSAPNPSFQPHSNQGPSSQTKTVHPQRQSVRTAHSVHPTQKEAANPAAQSTLIQPLPPLGRLYWSFGLCGFFALEILQVLDLLSYYSWMEIDFTAHPVLVPISGVILGLLCARLLEETYQTAKNPLWTLLVLSAGIVLLTPAAAAIIGMILEGLWLVIDLFFQS